MVQRSGSERDTQTDGGRGVVSQMLKAARLLASRFFLVCLLRPRFGCHSLQAILSARQRGPESLMPRTHSLLAGFICLERLAAPVTVVSEATHLISGETFPD